MLSAAVQFSDLTNYNMIVLQDGHFHTDSPIRDHRGTTGRRRRSHSASVHFKDTKGTNEEVRDAQTIKK